VRLRSTLAALLGAAIEPLSAQQAPLFTEITQKVKLDFVHRAGEEGKFALPEIMGGGAAFLDFDNDGDLDIYLVQSGPLPESKRKDRPPNRLFRQEPNGTFTDVTAEAGLGDTGYGTGVAVGDIDNDGFVDVYVGNYGPDALYRNKGNGRFENITAAAGISERQWTSSVAFCDYDLDGHLDIYVVHYVKNDAAKSCVRKDGAPDYCSPQAYSYEADTLYHNDGGGRFTDASQRSGIGRTQAPGLGVVCADFTGDGLPDFYVANDGEANQLWENQGNGTFVDRAILMGAAFDGFGRPEASMGVALGDIDGDADLDLFMTHLPNQGNTLYLNDGKTGFEDMSSARGVEAPSLKHTGFGTAFLDVDHDGDLDLIGVNGRVAWAAPLPGASAGEYWNPFAEPNFLLENDGRGKFREITDRSGAFGKQVEVSRALALGDVDADGDLDVLITNTGGPARLFRNDAAKKGRWLMVRALEGKRDAHGAMVTVTAGGKSYLRLADPAYSYFSSNDPRAHFGIPDASRADAIVVRWPGGVEESFAGGALDRVVVLRKGQGRTRSGK
jgi:hypothetical protein